MININKIRLQINKKHNELNEKIERNRDKIFLVLVLCIFIYYFSSWLFGKVIPYLIAKHQCKIQANEFITTYFKIYPKGQLLDILENKKVSQTLYKTLYNNCLKEKGY